MLVRFEWGDLTDRGSEEWTLEKIPRKDEYVELSEHAGYVRSVTYIFNVDEKPVQQAVVQLS